MCESVLGSEIQQVVNLLWDDYETAAESKPIVNRVDFQGEANTKKANAMHSKPLPQQQAQGPLGQVCVHASINEHTAPSYTYNQPLRVNWHRTFVHAYYYETRPDI